MKRLIINLPLGFIIIAALTSCTVLSLNLGPNLGAEWTVPDLGMKLVEVAPGSFEMGANQGNSNDKPVHMVRISKPFWMGKYEVTQAEYKKLMGKNPSDFDGDRKPVETVSWNDAVLFCKKLTERERRAGRLPDGYNYRLPTEAEWEYCCRAGSEGEYCFGDDVSRLIEYANYEDTPTDRTVPVGQYHPNAWGLHDMHGNVWEWCLDWYDDGYYKSTDGTTDPVNTDAALNRVLRGGGWGNSSGDVRSAGRDWFGPDITFNSLGFRVVLAPPVQ